MAAVGEGVTNVAVGERVGYATGPLGAYASARLYPAERLVKLPDALPDDAAAAVLFKGITAQYLLKTTHAVGPGSRIVIWRRRRCAGPVDVRLGQAPGRPGDRRGVQGSQRGARAGGRLRRGLRVRCGHAAGSGAAGHRGLKADVVYDPIGRTTLGASLDCLRPRGLLVSFGATSGLPDPISVATLNAKGSLFLTRPSLAAHTATAAEYQERARDVLAAVAAGIIVPGVWRRYALAEVAQAHGDLEQDAPKVRSS